jgi:hypothetical protein
MSADIVLKVIADMTNASPELKKLVKEMKNVNASMTKSQKRSKQFQDDLKSIAKVAATTGAVLFAFKKAFDFAEAGAGIMRLRESGNQLASSLGGNMDEIISKVKSASLNTVSDLDVITSSNRAMMLGLGADADQLANLMEVAAFRGRAMGLTTTQAFNDIVTGVGRMSPLILDNLGIVIDATTRYREWSEQTGIAVSQMDAATKKQVLFNAVLEDGNKQIDAAGGLVADAATQYEQLRATISDATNAGKEWLAGFLTPAVTAINVLITGQDKINDSLAEQIKKTIDGTKTYKEYEAEIIRLAGQTNRLIRTQEEMNNLLEQGGHGAFLASRSITLLNEAELNAIRTNSNLTRERQMAVIVLRDLSGATDEQATEYDELVMSLEGVTDSVLKSAVAFSFQNVNAAATRKLAGFYEDAEEAADSFFGRVDTGLSTSIARFLEELDFIAAGGENLEGLKDKIEEALSAGEITPEQADAMLEQLFIQAELLQVDMNNITAFEAAKNVSETLGITLQEALDRVNRTQQGLDAMDGITITITIQQNIQRTFTDATSAIPGLADGGPLTEDVTLVGEQGPELIIQDVVIPAPTTRKLLGLGLSPSRGFAGGGKLWGVGGGSSSLSGFGFGSGSKESISTVGDIEQATANLAGSASLQMQQVTDQIASSIVVAIENSNQQVIDALKINTEAVLTRSTNEGVGESVGQEMDKLI